MATTLSPVPYPERVLEQSRQAGQPSSGLLRTPWIRWLHAVKTAIDSAAKNVGPVSLTAQAASIAATAIPILTVTTGLFRITHYLRITQAGTVSGEVTLTIRWTDGGVAQSHAFAIVNGNTTATFQTGTLLIHADVSTTITYETTYATAGATSMQHALYIRAEAVP